MKPISMKAKEIRLIAISQIAPDPDNPHRANDEAALKELAASIRTHGIQQPIVLNRFESTAPDKAKRTRTYPYMIVCGHRRFEAAKLAGQTEIPAIVRELTLDQAHEIQMVENLQRADVHPMQEAEGYAKLLDRYQKNMHALAARVGKDIAHVTRRLRLNALVPEARALFAARDLTLGHATLLAAIEPLEQIRALRFILDPQGYNKKQTLDELAKMTRDPEEHESYVGHEKATERELRHFIEEEIALDLKKAPWDLDDKKLLPEAGACTNCPKRTGHNTTLFQGLIDVKDATCIDSACYTAKRQIFVQIRMNALRSAGKGAVQLSHKTSSAAPKGKPPVDDAADTRIFREGQWIEAKRGECSNVVTGVFVDYPLGCYGEIRRTKPGSSKLVCVTAGKRKAKV